MTRNRVEALTGWGVNFSNDARDLENATLICISFSSAAKFNTALTSREHAAGGAVG
jgi:hypothetical protein